MNRNPVTLFILALAMLLAPLGVCVARGHAPAAAPLAAAHATGMHDDAPQSGQAGHKGAGEHHLCADCQPPDFVAAAKAGADTALPLVLAPAIALAVVHARTPQVRERAHRWYGRAPPVPPPLPIATRVRLQI